MRQPGGIVGRPARHPDWLAANPIRLARKARGWTQAQAAAHWQIPEWAIESWEYGRRLPKRDKLSAIADGLGQDAALLWIALDRWLASKPRV